MFDEGLCDCVVGQAWGLWLATTTHTNPHTNGAICLCWAQSVDLPTCVLRCTNFFVAVYELIVDPRLRLHARYSSTLAHLLNTRGATMDDERWTTMCWWNAGCPRRDVLIITAIVGRLPHDVYVCVAAAVQRRPTPQIAANTHRKQLFRLITKLGIGSAFPLFLLECSPASLAQCGCTLVLNAVAFKI